MQVTAAAIQAKSAQLKDMGIDHIILPDGQFIVQADRASSAKWLKKFRASPAYAQYEKLVDKLKKAGKYGVNGGYTVKREKKLNKATGKMEWTGKFKIVKMDADEIAHRRAISKGMYKSSRVNHPKKESPMDKLKGRIASQHKPAAPSRGGRAQRD